MNKTAIIYCRVSTVKQLNNWESLDNQEEACRTFCERNDLQVVDVFYEAYTWKSSNRPVLNEAINNAKTNNINYFIVFDIDRFSREWYSGYTELKEKLESNNIILRDSKNIIWDSNIVIENDVVDMSQYKWNIESSSEYAEVLLSTQAKIEWKKIIQRTIPREIQLEQEWYRVRPSNYGFVNKKINTPNWKRTIQEQDFKEWKWVIEIFENRARWDLTDLEIVEELNLKWCKKRSWLPLDVKYLQELIVKPVYAGVISTKWTWNKPIKTPYEWLVSIETWNKANRWKIKIVEIDDKEIILEYNNWKEKTTDFPIIEKRKNYNPDYAYSKVLKCPHCEWELTANTSTSRDWTLHYYYQCRWKWWIKHKTYTVKRNESHDKIQKLFKNVKINDDILSKFDTILKEVYEERKEEINKNKWDYINQLKVLEKKEREIIDSIDSLIKFPTILEAKNKELEDIKSEKTRLEIRKNRVQKMSSLEIYKKHWKWLITHIDLLARQRENPELINLAFDTVFWWRIEYENLEKHTLFFDSFSANLSQQKNPQNEDLVENLKWQSH